MSLKEDLQGIIEINIDEAKAADRIFDNAVDPLMIKLTGIIPTEFDDVLYASKKEELKVAFREYLVEKGSILEEKIDAVLDEAPSAE